MAVQIIHKNSRVEFKNSRSEQLEFGELALNYHESGPYLQCKDAKGEIINLGGVYITAGATSEPPGDPLAGRLWLRKDVLFIWDGDQWIQIAGGGNGAGSSSRLYPLGFIDLAREELAGVVLYLRFVGGDSCINGSTVLLPVLSNAFLKVRALIAAWLSASGKFMSMSGGSVLCSGMRLSVIRAMELS